jgi:signal peptide peptidase SppA
MGRLVRLTNSIVNKPQLMEATALTDIVELLLDRNNGKVALAVDGGRERNARELGYDASVGVGYLSVDGPLTYLEYEPMCGEAPTSYQRLTQEFKALVSAGASTIVLDVDSPGGEAYACFETAKHLRTMANDAGVKVLAYVDGMCASAAYGLACIADEIIVNPMAEVGSIGVVVGLANTSEAEKKMGIKRTYVHAGASKIPFDADGNFTESFLSGLQETVDGLYLQFTSHVAEARNLSQEVVAGTEARMFSADKAIELGLADKTMTVAEFHNYLADLTEGKTAMPISPTLRGTQNMSQLADLQAQVATLLANAEASTAANLSAVAVAEAAATLAAAETATLVAELATFKEAAALALAASEAAAAQLVADARKASLSAVVGDEKATSLFASLSVLDDASFAGVVEAFATANKALDATPLFQEEGIGAEGILVQASGLDLVGQMIAANKLAKVK